jgi:hypothetical protein
MGTTDHVLETDEIYAEAMRAYKDLLDLGFNIESKHAGANAFMHQQLRCWRLPSRLHRARRTASSSASKPSWKKKIHDRDMNNASEGIIEGEGEAHLAYRKDLIDKIRKGEI